MRKWLRPDWRARLLDLFACFLIPLYTLLFTHDTRWFTTNFSVIAAARDQRHGFFLWGMLVGVYLLCVLLPVMAALPRPLWPRLCLLGGFLLLSLVLFAMVGIISSALEIFFVLSTTLLARRLWYLERGGGKN